LDPVLAFVSPKAGGWEKTFFVDVLMTDLSLGAYSNCLAIPGEEPSHVSASFSLGALSEHRVVGFLGGIFPATREDFRDHVRKPDVYINYDQRIDNLEHIPL
jgi:hypothetical protein